MILHPASRFPADPRAVFILAFGAFVGLTALLVGAEPGSLEETLPGWGILIWNVTLVAGSAMTLIGMFFKGINGIVAEQVGSMTVSVATVFYSIVMFGVVGVTAIVPAGIVLAWGLACFLRWVQLQMLIQIAYREKIHQEVLEEIAGEEEQ